MTPIDFFAADRGDARSWAREDAEKIGVDPNLAERMFGQESGFDNQARSPKGAFGIAQLMPGTADYVSRKYKVDTSTPRGNLQGGLYYLKEQLDEFGHDRPDLAVAAYHAGPGAVRKAGNRIPDTNDGLISTRDHVRKVVGGYQERATASQRQPPSAQPPAPDVDFFRAQPGDDYLYNKPASASQPLAEPMGPPDNPVPRLDWSSAKPSGLAGLVRPGQPAQLADGEMGKLQPAARAVAPLLQPGSDAPRAGTPAPYRQIAESLLAGDQPAPPAQRPASMYLPGREPQAMKPPPVQTPGTSGVDAGLGQLMAPPPGGSSQPVTAAAPPLRPATMADLEAEGRAQNRYYRMKNQQRLGAQEDARHSGVVNFFRHAGANLAAGLGETGATLATKAAELSPVGMLVETLRPQTREEVASFLRDMQQTATDVTARNDGESLTNQLLYQGGRMAPKMVVPGGTLGFGAAEALDALGHGAPPQEALRQGIEAAGTARLAGAFGETAARLRPNAGAVERFATQTLANSAAPATVHLLSEQKLPDAKGAAFDLAFGALFAMYGARVQGLDPYRPVKEFEPVMGELVNHLTDRGMDRASAEQTVKDAYADNVIRAQAEGVKPRELRKQIKDRAGEYWQNKLDWVKKYKRDAPEQIGSTPEAETDGQIADLVRQAKTRGEAVTPEQVAEYFGLPMERAEAIVGAPRAAAGGSEPLSEPAIWRNRDADQPVTVTGEAGQGPDGRDYVKIAESQAAIPKDEIDTQAAPGIDFFAPDAGETPSASISEPTTASGYRTFKPGDTVSHERLEGGKPLQVVAVSKGGRRLRLQRADGKGKAFHLLADSPEGRRLEKVEAEKEAAEPKYKYSSTQVNLPEVHASALKQLGETIPEEDLAGDGREQQPHITVKYGLHGNDADAVRKVVESEPPVTVRLGKTSVFEGVEGGNSDAVKLDVDSPDLHRLNKKIADALPHTDTYPDYKPHATVAYVKPGLGKKYAGNASLEGREITLDRIAFSDRDGRQIEIRLKGKPAAPPKATAPAETELLALDAAAHAAATSPLNELPEPTAGQIEAGNYRKGHVRIGGMDISIENPQGSKRRPEWPELKSHYGYIRRTEGGDGEHIDLFVKPGTPPDYSGPVFVVDQSNKRGEFDEHKVMLGFADEAAARKGYLENYTKGWKVGPIREFKSPGEFREWLEKGDTTKPAAQPDATASAAPEWVSQNLDVMTRGAEKSGLADKIEALAAQRKTAKETAAELGTDVDTVRVVRARRGIPSMDATSEFDQWLADRQQQTKSTVKAKAKTEKEKLVEQGPSAQSKLAPFEQAAIEKLRKIAKSGKRAPDGTQYISPQLTIEVKGKKRLVNVSAYVNLAGLEPVKGKPNYYRNSVTPDEANALLKEEDAESVKERLRKKTEDEKGRADIPVGLSISKVEKAPKQKTAEKEAAFPDEIEARWQAAKGARPPSLGQRLGEALTSLKHKATREYEHLPRTGAYAELRFKLHQLAKGKGIASDEAIRLLQGVTVKLNPDQYDVFTRKIILDDLYEEASRQESKEEFEDHRLPFGFEARTLASQHERISKLAEADADVATALADRRALVEEITGEYLKAAKEGVGFEPKLDREFYYRHQVLDHLNGTRATTGTGAKVKAPTARGFLRRRSGSELDINTEYLQAEHQVLSQMLHDTMAFRLLHYVDQHWNQPLRRTMKAEAKAANDEALQRLIKSEQARLPQPPPKTKPQTLAQFIRAQGRIKYDADLAGEQKWLKESANRDLVSRNGKLSPDQARELAEESGYIQADDPETNPGNFIETLARRGHEIYAREDLDELADRALDEYLESQMDDEALRQKKFQAAADRVGTTEAMLRLFKRKIGFGFRGLRQFATSGELWAGDKGEYKTAIENLKAHRNYGAPLSESGELFKYLGALASMGEAEGSMQARTIMKAVSRRREFIRQQLGKNFKEAEDFLPEGIALWQPRDGNAVYHVWSMPEQQINTAVEQALASVDVPVEKLRRVMAMGPRRRELAIPDAVALTLDNFGKAADHNIVATTMQKGVRTWKVWQLISPRRVIKYNLRNISGDLDATLAGNPGSLKRLGPAVTDLYNFLVRKSAPTPEMEEWLKRGGMYDLFQVAENMGDINGLKLFRNLAIGKSGKLEKINLWKQYWRAARLSTDFREAILRYATFLDYLEQIRKGNGKPGNYGASLRDEINALKDPHDKAYKLSNDLLGAYDEVSVFGQNLRETLFPFWSWQEVNAKRYKRLYMNAVYDGKTSRYAGRKFVSAAARSPLTALRIGKFILKASLLAAMLAAYNMLRFPKEEEELPADVRSKPHIILGRGADGKVRYFNRLGAAGDFLDWFGADEAPRHVRDYLNGRKTVGEIATDMAKSPFNKVVGAMGPTNTMYELLTGKTLYPDVTRPRGIRDRWEHLAGSLGVGEEYRMLAGKPTRGVGASLESFFDYQVDPAEAAYNEVLGLKSDYLRKLGKGTGDVASSPRSNAAYYLKLSLRYGDIEAAKRYLAEYKALDGTPQGLRQSLEQLDPLAGMKDSERQAFLNTLNADDRTRLVRAQDFYLSVLAESADNDLGPVDLLPRPIPRDKRQPVDRELRRLGVKLTFPERSMTIGGKPVEIPADQYGEYQQRAVEREYQGLTEMIATPGYQALQEPEQKKTLERYTQALADIEHDQVKAKATLDSSDAKRRDKFEARRDQAMLPLKERELVPNQFLLKQRVQRLRER